MSASSTLLDLMKDYADRSTEALDPMPSRVITVQPGATATWDGCKEGQLWVRLSGVEPIPMSTPARRTGADLCSVPEWIATFQVGIIRCAATMDSRGNPPPARHIIDDGTQGIEDMMDLLKVLADHPRTRSVTVWTPAGPEGGMHGGYWTFTVAVPNVLGEDG